MTDKKMDKSHTAHLHELARLDALHRHDLLDTVPSAAFDRITRMAAQLFGLPIAAVSLTDSDRQWFKSRVGVEHDSIPREKAPCGKVADTAAFLVIPDLQEDAYYRDSPLASRGVRFYAGAPLTTRDGFCLGAMCVLGSEPRVITDAERASLHDLADMVMSQIELQHAIGRVDALSGLPNRIQFIDDFADQDMRQPVGTQGLAALVNLATADQMNNAMRVMGSSYLDGVVGEAGRMLRSIGSKVYHVAPMELAFLAPPQVDEDTFCRMLERWLVERSRAVTSRFVTTASIGVARYTVGQTNSNDVLRNIHSAAQDAVRMPLGVRMYSAEQDLACERRFQLVQEFGAALEQRDQLRLVFQPKLQLGSGECTGAEALLRWTHPTLGEISPGEFIPVIEQTSMARATTAWVLEAAMTQLATWRRTGIHLQVAVNVSATNLLEPDFCAELTGALIRHGLEPGWLALEVTESTIMENPRVAQATLEALAAAGVHLAIDDFGTGYSSLAYLQSLPVKVVKIDQSFMRGIEFDARKQTLVSTMITLSHDLGYRVVAEGVETEAAAAVLAALACDEVQGYLYARPLTPQAFGAWFDQRRLCTDASTVNATTPAHGTNAGTVPAAAHSLPVLPKTCTIQSNC